MICGDLFSVGYSKSKTKNGDFPCEVNHFANGHQRKHRFKPQLVQNFTEMRAYFASCRDIKLSSVPIIEHDDQYLRNTVHIQ